MQETVTEETAMSTRGAWIETWTGRQFFLEDPRPDEVCIEDIARALSLLCRFTGHVNRFYSVAEHSLLVMQNLPLKFQAWGLLHDAAEAYLGDLSAPLKGLAALAPYREIESLVLGAVFERFGLALGIVPPMVKQVDLRMLLTERRDLMPSTDNEWSVRGEPFPHKITDWVPTDIEAQFLRDAKRLGLE
jgi:hypothetical protein